MTDSTSSPMRLLVTGHLGYLGVEMTPLLVLLGHEVVGLDTGYYDGCDFLAPPDPVPHAGHRSPRRRPRRTSTVSMPSSTSPRSRTIRCPTSTRDLTYDINLDASVRLAEAAKAAGVGRFLFSSSCSLYGAGGDLDSRRDRGVQPRHAVRRVEGARRAGSVAGSPTTTSRRCTCATPRRTASRGDCVPTSSSTTSSGTRSPRARCCCRATARRGGRSCTSSTSPTRSSGARRASRRSSTTRRSTSVGSARTIASATSPTSSPRSCPTASSDIADGCHRRTSATTASTSPRSRASSPGYRPQWTLRQGIEELLRGVFATAG